MPPKPPLCRVFLLFTVCALILVTGCGRKGPLYLPPPPPADTGQAQPSAGEGETEAPPKAGPAAR